MSKKFAFKFSISLSPKPMSRQEMAALLDSYIAQLQEAKAMLLSGETTKFQVRLDKSKRKPIGREARRKIADAQRARWARVKGSIVPHLDSLEGRYSANRDAADQP